MKKKLGWNKPKLMVLVRGKDAEPALTGCKANPIPGQFLFGPQPSFSYCGYNPQPYVCGICSKVENS